EESRNMIIERKIPQAELHGGGLDGVLCEVLQSIVLKDVIDPAAIFKCGGQVATGFNLVGLAAAHRVEQVDRKFVDWDQAAGVRHVELRQERVQAATVSRNSGTVVKADGGHGVVVKSIDGNEASLCDRDHHGQRHVRD